MPLAFNSKSTNIPLKYVSQEQFVSTSKVKVVTLPVVKQNPAQKKSVSMIKPKTTPKELAQMLFNQISGPSLNKNTIAILKMITNENVADVIIEYQKISKKNSLMIDIDNEYGLDIDSNSSEIISGLKKIKRMELLINTSNPFVILGVLTITALFFIFLSW